MAAISVIIPARNDAEHLRACLQALARQVRPADEVIVVDNASTDATAEVARAAGARVVVEPVLGTAAAAAAGFDAAAGDVLARLDADSLPPPDWLHRVEAGLQNAVFPAALTGPGVFYSGNAVSRWVGTAVYIPGYFWLMGLVLGHPPLFGSNLAMHSAVWSRYRDRVHRTVRTIHDDLDLSIQLEPGIQVRLDRTLTVGVSARPLATPGGLARRLWWVWLTLRLSGGEESLRRRRSRWR